VTFRTRTGGKALGGYYSFVEDFRRDGKSVGQVRRAFFGNGWVRGLNGSWASLHRATFTGSSAEWEAKENIDAGMSGNQFYLATGGSITNTGVLGRGIELPANAVVQPPQLPEALQR
jgi:hypothetical protein